MDSLLAQKNFLDKYKIDFNDFEKTTLNWQDLEEIYNDYGSKMNELDRSAYPIFNTLIKVEKVHSVRYRIKDPEHVIEKIIRKRIKDPNRIINIENYFNELTDLIGVRAIHLFKNDWIDIHKEILTIWRQKEKPIYYFREGDKIEENHVFKNLGCKVALHPRHYRSVHYIIKTNPTKQEYIAEIQVRTLFEEGWSEIDHKIRYPYNLGDSIQNDFLSILNRLAGSADEMGSFIKNLRDRIEQYENQLSDLKNNAQEIKSNISDSEDISADVKGELVEGISKVASLADNWMSLKAINAFYNPLRPLDYKLESEPTYQAILDAVESINNTKINIPFLNIMKGIDNSKQVSPKKIIKSKKTNKDVEKE